MTTSTNASEFGNGRDGRNLMVCVLQLARGSEGVPGVVALGGVWPSHSDFERDFVMCDSAQKR